MNPRTGYRGKKKSGNCENCGTYRELLQRDHIIPVHRGGIGAKENIQYLCANCHEDKTRLELSELAKGRTFSEEHKRKIGLARKGKTFTDEHKENLAISLRNKLSQPEVRENMRNSHLGKPWSQKRRDAQDRKTT